MNFLKNNLALLKNNYAVNPDNESKVINNGSEVER